MVWVCLGTLDSTVPPVSLFSTHPTQSRFRIGLVGCAFTSTHTPRLMFPCACPRHADRPGGCGWSLFPRHAPVEANLKRDRHNAWWVGWEGPRPFPFQPCLVEGDLSSPPHCWMAVVVGSISSHGHPVLTFLTLPHGRSVDLDARSRSPSFTLPVLVFSGLEVLDIPIPFPSFTHSTKLRRHLAHAIPRLRRQERECSCTTPVLETCKSHPNRPVVDPNRS